MRAGERIAGSMTNADAILVLASGLLGALWLCGLSWVAGWRRKPSTLRSGLPARDDRQVRVAQWAQAAFGVAQATSLRQRGVRLLEEALEAFQAADGDREMAHRLVDYVFSCPVGSLAQELGGVGVCVLALAAAAGVSADDAERAEVDCVIAKPLAHFRQRNDKKNDAGFLALRPPHDKDLGGDR